MNIEQIKEKIRRQERLNRDDGIYLYEHSNLTEIGQLAHSVRTTKAQIGHETSVWWNTNLHLNPTNVCIGRCNFCAFAKLPNEEGAYTMTIEEATERAAKGHSLGATEVHIVGGLNPKAALPYYLELLKSIKVNVPSLHIKAFTAVEIAFFAKLAKKTYKQVLIDLVEAGLDSMPGGGAEIFAKSVRDETCPDKIPSDLWLEIHSIAHEVGLYSNATMLAGIGESFADRVDHMLKLRTQQDKSKGFQTFIPLSCHYEDTEIIESVDPITSLDQVKNIAISRLILDNFDHIKAYWPQLGHSMAQVALNFGADDLDGTVVDERITYAAGSGRKKTSTELICQLIQGAGFEPVERNTIYGLVDRKDAQTV